MDSATGEKLLALMGNMMQTLQAVTPWGTSGSSKVGETSKCKSGEESQSKVDIEIQEDSEGEISEKGKTPRAVISESSETEQYTPPPKSRWIIMASNSEAEVVRSKTSKIEGKRGVNVGETMRGKKTRVD